MSLNHLLKLRKDEAKASQTQVKLKLKGLRKEMKKGTSKAQGPKAQGPESQGPRKPRAPKAQAPKVQATKT